MAVFLGNIKGLDVSGSQFTYMVFDAGTGSAPVLYRSVNNIHSTSEITTGTNTKIGRILVDTADYIQELKNFKFQHIYDSNNSEFLHIGTGTNARTITFGSNTTLANVTNITGLNTLSASNISITSGTATNFTSENMTISALLTAPIGNWNVNGITMSNTSITPNYVQAPYFNATSDRRAKTNLQVLPNVLNIINQTPVYSFNYKETNLPSIGIMAQDVEQYNFDEFKLVDSSSDGILSIHESKLVYILWKGIQEQQKQIEQLKLEIKSLKEDC